MNVLCFSTIIALAVLAGGYPIRRRGKDYEPEKSYEFFLGGPWHPLLLTLDLNKKNIGLEKEDVFFIEDLENYLYKTVTHEIIDGGILYSINTYGKDQLTAYPVGGLTDKKDVRKEWLFIYKPVLELDSLLKTHKQPTTSDLDPDDGTIHQKNNKSSSEVFLRWLWKRWSEIKKTWKSLQIM